jgi:hypothetical protein
MEKTIVRTTKQKRITDSKLIYLYLAGLIDATTLKNYLQSHSTVLARFFTYTKETMGKSPISNITKLEQTAIENLVGYILYLTDIIKDLPSHPKTLDQSVVNKRIKSYFEQIINALVVELYLPEELHEHNKYFMRYLLEENLPNIDIIKGDKMQTLQEIFARLFDKEHPIRHNLFLLNTIPVVRIIEDKS